MKKSPEQKLRACLNFYAFFFFSEMKTKRKLQNIIDEHRGLTHTGPEQPGPVRTFCVKD
jgi:hypothetical protein